MFNKSPRPQRLINRRGPSGAGSFEHDGCRHTSRPVPQHGSDKSIISLKREDGAPRDQTSGCCFLYTVPHAQYNHLTGDMPCINQPRTLQKHLPRCKKPKVAPHSRDNHAHAHAQHLSGQPLVPLHNYETQGRGARSMGRRGWPGLACVC